MDYQNLISRTDHTQLNPTATWEMIQKTCDEGIAFGAASVCIPGSYVREAAQYVGGRIPICTVIGFPHGNATTGAKLFEAKNAIMDGASEVDMVINLGYLKDRRFEKIFSEISGTKAMIGEAKVLKVIVETCLLTEEEKVHLCLLVGQAGADFIKTSTGFSTGGATAEDIQLLARHAGNLKIKASGGISTLEDAQRMLELGAHRLGSSKIIDLLRAAGVHGSGQ